MKVELNNIKEVKKYLDDFPEAEFERAKVAFQNAVLEAANETKKNCNTGGLHVRTGNLQRSINQSVTGNSLATLKADVYSAAAVGGKPVVYAPVHEGLVDMPIRAKNKYKNVPGGPYLHIPLPGNKTARGVTRLQGREVFAQGGRLFKSKKGNWLVSLKGVLMFVLVKQVTIPARLGMRQAAENQVPTLLQRLSEF